MEVKIENFDPTKSCRVCLHIYPEMIPLFGSGNILSSYSEMLIMCSRINIEINDGLPVVICEYCVEKMVQACDFVSKCKETDKQLRLYLEKKTIDSVSDDMKIDIKDLDNIKQEPDFDYTLENIHTSEDYKEEPEEKYLEDVKYSRRTKKWKPKKKKYKTLDCLKRKRSKSSPLNCEQCGLLVRTKSAMVIHVATHSEDRPFQCHDCGKSYRSRGNLKKHIIKIHCGEERRLFRCGDCSKAFYCNSELVIHSRTHTGETPHQCEWCPKAFAQLSSLARHRLTHTGEKAFQCAVCGKKFSTRDNLKNHMLVHTTEKNFSCKICGALLKTRGSLGKHQLLHTNIKSFVCDQCGHPFRTKGNLKLHMDKKHSEKSGYCTICSRRFSNIDEHNNVHTGKTPFQCSMCNKKYGVKRSLQVHMRKHDNQDKYSCDYEGCLKKFPLKCMLEFHVLKYHTKQTPHMCEYCNRGFFRLNDLNLHKKMNHLCIDVPKNTSENKT